MIEKFLRKNNIPFKRNVKYRSIISLNEKGYVKLVIYPLDTLMFIKILDYLNKYHHKFKVISNGSKVFFKAKSYPIIIKLTRYQKISYNSNLVKLTSGVHLNDLLKFLENRSLGDVFALRGIPGRIGGLIYNNASFLNTHLTNYLVNVEAYDNGKIVILRKEELELGYRSSIFKRKNIIILEATFKFEKITKEEIDSKYLNSKQYRLKHQEANKIGSLFLNYNGLKAYKIIDSLNLNNFHYKNIYLADKHSNFLMTKGEITGKNLAKFIKKIQTRVEKKLKIKLESELEMIS